MVMKYLCGYLNGLDSQDDTYKSFLPVPQFPMGFSVAASVRVGNALGAGNTEQAKLSGKISVICACMN